jgi:hypothetical protein
LVQAVLETFPGATIAAVRERFAAAAESPAAGEEPGANDADDTDTGEANTGEDRE